MNRRIVRILEAKSAVEIRMGECEPPIEWNYTHYMYTHLGKWGLCLLTRDLTNKSSYLTKYKWTWIHFLSYSKGISMGDFHGGFPWGDDVMKGISRGFLLGSFFHLGNFKGDFKDVKYVEGNLKGDFSWGISQWKWKWGHLFLIFPFSYSPLKFISWKKESKEKPL